MRSRRFWRGGAGCRALPALPGVAEGLGAKQSRCISSSLDSFLLRIYDAYKTKFVSNAPNYNDVIPLTQQTFTDMPPSYPFWLFAERDVLHGVISGYADQLFYPVANVIRRHTDKFISNVFSRTAKLRYRLVPNDGLLCHYCSRRDYTAARSQLQCSLNGC